MLVKQDILDRIWDNIVLKIRGIVVLMTGDKTILMVEGNNTFMLIM